MTTIEHDVSAGVPSHIGSDEPDSWPVLNDALGVDSRSSTRAADEERLEPIELEDLLEVRRSPPPPPPVSRSRRITTARATGSRPEPELLVRNAIDEAPERLDASAAPMVDERHALRRQRGVLVVWILLLSCANVYLLLTRDGLRDGAACPVTADTTEHALVVSRSEAPSSVRPGSRR